MEINENIYIAGHRGMVGSALTRKLKSIGYKHIITRTSAELDLTNQQATAAFFEKEKPDYVFLAAARVGGIMANNIYRADFIYDNIQIQNNVIHHSYLHGVKKLLFLGSSCIYPKMAPQPLKEEYLLTSELEYTNEPYAIAKIAGIKMCESYNIQHGTNFIAVMPTNLYGPNDNYDLEKSHVFPALIRKITLGKLLEENNWELIKKDLNKRPVEKIDGTSGKKEILDILSKYGIRKALSGKVSITLWGTGTPRREFLHADDLADACIYIMKNINFEHPLLAGKKKNKIRNTHVNLGTGTDIPIRDLALLISKILKFNGDIEWDTSKPDGTPRKLLEVSKMRELGFYPSIDLEKGVKITCANYLEDIKS
ncbi:MAG: GDP-L-fucose synthase family protein [Bacteroidota bacterium]